MVELQKCLHVVNKNTDMHENALEKLSEEDKRNIINVLGLRDSSGLTPLLFAADRGLVEVSEYQTNSTAHILLTTESDAVILFWQRFLGDICSRNIEYNIVISLLLCRCRWRNS